MKFTLLTFLFATNTWAATTTETFRVPVKSFEGLNFQCTPGIKWNGHNFPTPSQFTISLYGFIPTYNFTTAWGSVDDFNNLLGDHCAELADALRAQIPNTMTATRTFKDSCENFRGELVRSVQETVILKMGNFDFSNTQTFIAGKCN